MNKSTRTVLNFGCEFLKPDAQNAASLPVEPPARESIAHHVDVALYIMRSALLTISEFGCCLRRRGILSDPFGRAGAASEDRDRD